EVSCAKYQSGSHAARTPDTAPATQGIAASFTPQRRKPAGRCASVSVNSESPALAAGQSAGQRRAPNPPIDAWIPDSSLWVDQARNFPLGAKTVQPAGFSVAQSPLMLVMPKIAASHVPAFGKVGWRILLPHRSGGPIVPPGVPVDLPDPSQSAAG